MASDIDVLMHLVEKVDQLHRKLDALGGGDTQTWLDSTEFGKLVGLNSDQLGYQIRKGRISGDCMRNVGTAKRPRYRFHREKATDRFLNGAG
jgi:hypothetical protein